MLPDRGAMAGERLVVTSQRPAQRRTKRRGPVGNPYRTPAAKERLTPMTENHSEMQAIADGLELVKALLLAYADDDQQAALRLINDAPDGASRWATNYLAAAMREVVSEHHNHKKVLTQRALRRMADVVDNNILETQMDLLTRDDEDG